MLTDLSPPAITTPNLCPDYLQIPPEKIHTVRLGINMAGHGAETSVIKKDMPFTIGYLARICPEKGLHILAEAFHILSQKVGREQVRLKIAGYLGKRDYGYLKKVQRQIHSWDLGNSVDYAGEVDRVEKITFLNSLHVLSVPTPYNEPKGLFVIEALANGVPVVQPEHGAFPEIINATGGGLLVAANDPRHWQRRFMN